MDDSIFNPNDQLEIPNWLNKDYFKVVIDKDEPTYKEIMRYNAVAAIPAGENFTSTILCIYIDLKMHDGSFKRKSYILKTVLPFDKGGKEMAELGLFDKELKMYDIYLPAFESLYKSAGRNVQLAPKCLFTEKQNEGINFVFEDLRQHQFCNINRHKGLDIIHMHRALEKLAEFHAASAVYASDNGPYPKEFEEGLFSLKAKDFHLNSFEIRQNAFKKSMKHWDMQDGHDYVNRFPTKEQYWQMSLKTLESHANDFNVLGHGDCWSSNIMFNYYAENKINEVLFVDFQFCKWGSPAQDLLFIIITSAASEIRLINFDNFIEFYHTKLTECLGILKYKKSMPKLRDLHKTIYDENNTFYAFFAVFNNLPIIQFPNDCEISISLLFSDGKAAEELRLRLFTNPAYMNIMKELYPFLCKRGLLNFKDFV